MSLETIANSIKRPIAIAITSVYLILNALGCNGNATPTPNPTQNPTPKPSPTQTYTQPKNTLLPKSRYRSPCMLIIKNKCFKIFLIN